LIPLVLKPATMTHFYRIHRLKGQFFLCAGIHNLSALTFNYVYLLDFIVKIDLEQILLIILDSNDPLRADNP
jgi:hypothetical protein